MSVVITVPEEYSSMGHMVGIKDFSPRLALSLFLTFKMLVAVSDFFLTTP